MNYEYCDGMTHTIKQGDTLYSISRLHKVPLGILLRANPYVDVYNLQIGDTICIPVKNQVCKPDMDCGSDINGRPIARPYSDDDDDDRYDRDDDDDMYDNGDMRSTNDDMYYRDDDRRGRNDDRYDRDNDDMRGRNDDRYDRDNDDMRGRNDGRYDRDGDNRRGRNDDRYDRGNDNRRGRDDDNNRGRRGDMGGIRMSANENGGSAGLGIRTDRTGNDDRQDSNTNNNMDDSDMSSNSRQVKYVSQSGDTLQDLFDRSSGGEDVFWQLNSPDRMYLLAGVAYHIIEE